MYSVFHSGVDSAKISFPLMSLNVQLSAKDLGEIENAITQMELWNAVSSIPTPPKVLAPVKADALVEIGKGCSSALVNADGQGTKVEVPVVAADGDNQDVHKGMVEAHVYEPPLVGPEVARRSQVVSKMVRDENSCFDRVLLGMDPCSDLHRSSFHPDPPVQPKKVNSASKSTVQPLQPIKSGEQVPELTDGIIPDRPSVHQPRYRVRRKPVPRFSDLPSSPTPAPRELKDVSKNGIIDSFPALDSGSFSQHYRIDPEELEVPLEMRIHNLTVKKLLGVGGQGRVYLAQGPTMRLEEAGEEGKQMVFAVKVMIKNRHVQHDDILQEQRLLRRLRGNMSLLQLEGSFHDKKNFYLITEYHSGGDLEGLLRGHGCFAPPAARIYTAELCAAVAFLHEKFILHRDIKPSNVLLKADGHICLSDFGLAVDFLDHTIYDDEDSFMADAEPVIRGCAGTTTYMAPEVLNGEYYGFKADWWSVGATCFNLFEGSHPWPCLEVGWLAECAGVEPVRFRVTSDDHVRSLIHSLLRRDQDQRIGDRDLSSHSFFNGLIQDVYEGRLVPPHIPKPFNTQHILNTLVKNDLTEIGGNYPKGATPMANYIFYGPNLPEYEPSPDEIDHTYREEKFHPPFNCSPSLYELLQMSFSQIGSVTLNNASGNMFAPPDQLDTVSGSTIVEEYRLEVEARPEVMVIRKDPKFRWSILSAEEGQFQNATGPLTNETSVSIKAGGSADRPGQLQEGSMSPSGSRSRLELASSSEAIVQLPRAGQSEPGLEPELEFEHESEITAPVIPSTPGLTSPRQKAIYRNAKLTITNSEGSTKFNANPDANTSMLSPTNTKNKGNFTLETVALSLLGFVLCVGCESNMTGLTTLDLSVSESPATSPCEFSHKHSAIDFGSCGIATGQVFVSGGVSEFGSRAGPADCSILGNLNVNKPLPPLPAGSNRGCDGSGDDTSENWLAKVGVDAEGKDYTTGNTKGATLPLESTNDDRRTRQQHLQGFHEHVMDGIGTFLRTITRVTSEWIKHLWATTSSRKVLNLKG